jgi:hypothetical protein
MFGKKKEAVKVIAVYAVRTDSTGGFSREEPVTLYDANFKVLGRGKLGDYTDILVCASTLQNICNGGRASTSDEMDSGDLNGSNRHAVTVDYEKVPHIH